MCSTCSPEGRNWLPFPGFEGTTAALFNPLRGKPVETVPGSYQTANVLEHKYAEAGYILARVVIPPQGWSMAGPCIYVIDGVIERVDEGRAGSSARRCQARMAAFVGVRHVTLDEIERRLLLVSDIPGLQVRSTLPGRRPGNAPGAASEAEVCRRHGGLR